MNNIGRKLKNLTNNATFAAIIGATAGFVLGMFTKSYQLHDAVTYNNISSYIESLMVSSGLISEEILSLETPFDQLSMIANNMTHEQTNYNNILDGLRKYLISIGKNESLIETYTTDELLDMLSQTSVSVSATETENEHLIAELKELKKQTTAILFSPKLKILGESIDSTMKNHIAIIDGHIYYSENLLNTFLPESIMYKDEVILYGQATPEKVNVIDLGLLYDNSNYKIYDGSSHFTMSHQDYFNGIVLKSAAAGSVSIACNENYSELSLIPGHIDNTPSGNRTLKISYRNSNGIFIEGKSVDLYAEMPIDPISVPIYNTKTVKIEITGVPIGGEPIYGLANIYLIK